MRDPRSSRRYRATRAAWLAGYRGQPSTCALCGGLVDTSLPARAPGGPTIEHLLPVRTIRASARDWAHAVALACDTSLWALAHRRCQDRQGQRATTAINRQRNNLRHEWQTTGTSRDW
jgi:hypothetical protein